MKSFLKHSRGSLLLALICLLPSLALAQASISWGDIDKTGSTAADLGAQPVDSDLTSIAALSTTSYGRSLLTQADATAAQATLALVPGIDVEAYGSGRSIYAPARGIMCVGDSYTYCQYLGGQVAEPWPRRVAASLGVSTVNRGLQGYIPRHRAYDLLIHDAPTILMQDFLVIPPTQWEDRVNQPATNNLRTFYSDGQYKWVHLTATDQDASKLYRFSASSTATADGVNVIQPFWVGTGKNNPEYTTGRWLLQSGTYTPAANKYTYNNDTNLMNYDMIIWLGGNGFEVADTLNGINMILRNRGPRAGRFWVVTLSNRLTVNDTESDILNWDTWTKAVNAALRASYPGHVIDVDGYLMQRKQEETFDHFIAADSNDTADLALYGVGVVPRSIKEDATGGHLNQLGYDNVASYIGRHIGRELGLPWKPPVDLAGFTRFFQASSQPALYTTGRVKSVPNYSYNKDGVNLIPEVIAGVTYPTPTRGVDSNGAPTLDFDGTAAIYAPYSVKPAVPRTLVMDVKLNALPATRGDVLDSANQTGGADRCFIWVKDFSGQKRWQVQSSSATDTGVVADLKWHTIVAVFSGASTYFYYDGVKYGPYTTAATSYGGIVLGGATSPAQFSVHEVGDYAGAVDDAWVATYVAQHATRYPLSNWSGNVIYPSKGGTGVDNGTSTLTLGGNLTTSGAYATTLTTTGTTTLTLPTSGTLLTTTGNAATATKLATPRALNGVNFDGSAAVTVPAHVVSYTGGAVTISGDDGHTYTITATQN